MMDSDSNSCRSSQINHLCGMSRMWYHGMEENGQNCSKCFPNLFLVTASYTFGFSAILVLTFLTHLLRCLADLSPESLLFM